MRKKIGGTRKFLLLVSIWLLMICSGLATPAMAQTAPTDVYAAPGNSSAAVSFYDDDSTITGYTVTAYDPSDNVAGTQTGTGSPIVVGGLTNGTAYTFKVTATNGTTFSAPSSASNSATPGNNLYAAWAGEWNNNFFFAGQAAPYWIRSTETLNADGTVSGALTDSKNDIIPPYTGATWLFPYGMAVTINSGNPFSNEICFGSMDNDVVACTATWPDGSPVLVVGTKQKQGVSPYSMSDLASKWVRKALDIGQGGYSSWDTAAVTMQSSGSFQGTDTKSDGTHKNVTGTMSLSAEGVLTCASGACNDTTMAGYMDAGKNIVAGVEGGDSSGNGGVNDAQVFVISKAASSYSLADLAGLWAGSRVSSDGAWKRMSLAIYPNGTFTSSDYSSDGSINGPNTGKIQISSTGTVTCSPVQPKGGSCSDVNAFLDAGKTVMTEVATNSSNSYSLQIIMKMAGVPGVPTHVTVAASGIGQAQVSFTPPTATGGSPLTYTVKSSPGGFTGEGTSSPVIVSGLGNGNSYTFTVTATNEAGLSVTSGASGKITAWAAPSQPAITSLKAGAKGSGQVTVNFRAPASNGGCSITYTVKAYDPSDNVAATIAGLSSKTTSAIVKGLESNTSYTFTVTATNAVGSTTSKASASIKAP